MGDKDAYRKLLKQFYEDADILKRRPKLERKLREAQEELEIISSTITGKIDIEKDEEGALYLCFDHMKVYEVYIKLGRWCETEIVDNLELGTEDSIKVGPELCNLKTNLQWTMKEIQLKDC